MVAISLGLDFMTEEETQETYATTDFNNSVKNPSDFVFFF